MQKSVGNPLCKASEQMDTPSVIFYEHDINDSQVRSLSKGVLNLGNECRALAEENDRLKAEVERLTKAGDAMAKQTEFFQKRWDADELCQEVEAWNAAKEGKQS